MYFLVKTPISFWFLFLLFFQNFYFAKNIDKTEPTSNLTTWVYEEGSFVPTAKITEKGTYSIFSDYLGRPTQAFDSNDKLVWHAEYDIYGKIKMLVGNKRSIPFRQLGQYEDSETELYYNRFRYYDSNTGAYISKDPIGLNGGNNQYSYVYNSNTEVDPLGLYGVPRDTPAWNARDWQASSVDYSPDSWRTVTLSKGTVVYGGVPGQSPFYLSEESFKASGGVKGTLWESAQVKPNEKLGYRPQVQAYVLTEDIKVGKSTAIANTDFGKGGATQYFIEDYESKLKPVGDPINLKCS